MVGLIALLDIYLYQRKTNITLKKEKNQHKSTHFINVGVIAITNDWSRWQNNYSKTGITIICTASLRVLNYMPIMFNYCNAT